MLTGKRVVVTGGTGSLGRILVGRLLAGELGHPEEVVVFSRDEAKQHAMRLALARRDAPTDDIIYEHSRDRLRFSIGAIEDPHAVARVLRAADIVFNAAALKQVPTCEYHPFEAVKTNVLGAENIVRTILEHDLDVELVVGISTDKACKPVNVMGMTKALQERLFIQANLECARTRFVVARYGNVLASRGSVIPLFHEQIRVGGPITITTNEMTRFLISLDRAVDLVFTAACDALPGETYVPRLPSAFVTDIAKALIGDRPIATEMIGIRPGEKIHEILVSEEEAPRTLVRGDHLVIEPSLPQFKRDESTGAAFDEREFSSGATTLAPEDVLELLRLERLLIEDEPTFHA